MDISNDNRYWECDVEKLKEMVTTYFSELFKGRPREQGDHNYLFISSYVFGGSSDKLAHCFDHSRDQEGYFFSMNPYKISG